MMTVVLAGIVAAAVGVTAWSVVRLHTDDLRQIARLTVIEQRLMRDETAVCRAIRQSQIPDGKSASRLRC